MGAEAHVLRTPVYLDHHATTPCDPRVVEAMLPYFTTTFGNAASRNHAFGWQAEEAVERARGEVAALVGATPAEIVWTSGATESDNLMLKGAARHYRDKGDHVVTMATEHKAVLDACHALEGEGFRVTYLAPGRDGRLDPAAFEAALTPGTILASVMAVNNEVGTIQPVQELARIARARGVLFAVDAAQAPGRVPLETLAPEVDLLALSAHKMYGPKGVGALYVRRRPKVRLVPLLDGGGHERGMRPGTLNVPGIVGMGCAATLAREEGPAETARIRALRDRLHARIEAGLDGVHVNGGMEHRVAGNLNLSFDGVDGEALLLALKDVAVSSGSACSSASIEPSHVLRALGLSPERAHASVRFGLGRPTTEEEVDFAADRVVATVKSLRMNAATYDREFGAHRATSGEGDAPLRVRDA
jgi:cysteine desulfurase